MATSNTFAWPKMFNRDKEAAILISDEESVSDCLYLLVNSARYELLGDPNFGSEMLKYQFRGITDSYLEDFKNNILSLILTYETRIVVTENSIYLEPIREENKVIIHISYYLKKSDKTVEWAGEVDFDVD